MDGDQARPHGEQSRQRHIPLDEVTELLDLDFIQLATRIPVILLALTVHECAHGYFAYRMGDPTAYRQGRLTLNPLPHLDLLGTICLLIAPIGWAKPVPINPLNFQDRRKGILVSTAAGPASNLVQAFLFALLLRGLIFLSENAGIADGHAAAGLLKAATLMAVMAVLINVGLAVFNLLPLFPLDGFHITLQLLPADKQQRFAEMAPIGPFAILAVVFGSSLLGIDLIGRLIFPPVNFLLHHVAGLG